MIKQIDLMFRTMVAELQQRAFDDDWAEDFRKEFLTIFSLMLLTILYAVIMSKLS